MIMSFESVSVLHHFFSIMTLSIKVKVCKICNCFKTSNLKHHFEAWIIIPKIRRIHISTFSTVSCYFRQIYNVHAFLFRTYKHHRWTSHYTLKCRSWLLIEANSFMWISVIIKRLIMIHIQLSDLKYWYWYFSINYSQTHTLFWHLPCVTTTLNFLLNFRKLNIAK